MIDLVPYGVPAEDALMARIAACKSDPLAPVTVIVPSNYAGLSVRRSLAARSPLVNVRFQVLARLAELLGAPRLVADGRRPLTPWLGVMGVRAALAELPGVFAEVAGHPSTARELHRTFRELREASEASLEDVSRSTQRAADVVRLYRRFRELTAGYFDEFDLLESAAGHFREDSAVAREAGALVVYLPRGLSQAAGRLFVAAGEGRAHAIFGLTGDEEVDSETRAMARRFPGASHELAASIPQVARVVSATDPEEEAREAIRQAMALTAEGTPLHRIAITYATRETYEGLLDDALTSAGLPHNGPPNRTLGQSLAGRTILGLPRLAASGGPGEPAFSREAVMDWLTAAPIFDGGAEAPSQRWDEISRDARVVKGVSQWQSRLELFAATQDAEAADREEGERAHFERKARWARSLRAFVADLAAQLGPDRRQTGSRHAAQALEWLDRYLPERAVEDEAQLEARQAVQQLLESVARLDAGLPAELNPQLDRAEFAAALDDALAQPAGRLGKLGDGIFIGPVALAAEMSFDAVFVLGMVEGAFPAGFSEDPVLSTEDRVRANGELAMPASRLNQQRRGYLGALHAAGHRVLSTPRGDLRAQRPAQPSRWILEAASSLSGERMYATELAALLDAPPAWFRVVRSFESALREPGEPASAQEWDLGSLLRYEGRLDRHFLLRDAGQINPLARGVAARRSRQRVGGGPLDGWRGKVPAGSAPAPDGSRPISPTALETYAKCPLRYFFGQVLKVGEVERPEETITIEPATIGNIVHEILQKFFEATAERPDPFADWTPQERDNLLAITQAVFEDFEARGQTGKSLTWLAEQARIRRDLELLLDKELEERRVRGARFFRAEAAFGVRASAARPEPLPAASLTLPDGSTVSFRGVVDRVDIGPGGELSVIDYKTGSSRNYEALKPTNPLGGGKFLQLPVYALAFRAQSAGPVTARYWFISEQAGFEQKEVRLDEAAFGRFSEIVGTLVETMRAGYFPAVPGDETWNNGDSYDHCRYCPYDLVCPSNQRSEAWMYDRKDAGLAAFVALSEISTEAERDDS
ncbi:MAG: PD-(D/E)XK nuclease family protein [Dehalococcoidia bacterium]|jgi:RecB family exonuclease